MINLLLKLLGDPNSKKIKKMMPIVEHINKLEPEMESLTDEQLRAKTQEFKDILAKNAGKIKIAVGELTNTASGDDGIFAMNTRSMPFQSPAPPPELYTK